jgi:hypothetical protein
MRHPLSSVPFCLALSLLANTSPASGQAAASLQSKATNNAKVKMALISSDATKTRERDSNLAIAAAFEDAMLKAGRFVTLSRDMARERELSYASSGSVDPASAAKLGKAMSANYVVVARQISWERKAAGASGKKDWLKKTLDPKSEYTFSVQAQAIDVETSEIIQSETFSKSFVVDRKSEGSPPRDRPDLEVTADGHKLMLDSLAMEFMSQLAAAIPLKAVVVMIRDAGNIAISAGQDAGLRPGARFEIIQEGEPIKGPDGSILGYDSKTVGTGELVRVDAKLSWMKLISTVGIDGSADPAPRLDRVKQHFTVKMVGNK